MTDIRYLAPRTLDEAISAFAAAGTAARIMAGGTDLLVQMRSGAVRPGLIVDIKKIAEMTAIEETAGGGFRVGAAVSGAVLGEHPRFGKVWPGVLEAVNLIGSTQVQGRASAGGNLCNGSPAGDSVPALVAAGAIVVSVEVDIVEVVVAVVPVSSTTVGCSVVVVVSVVVSSFFLQPVTSAVANTATRPRVTSFFISLISFSLQRLFHAKRIPAKNARE